MKPQLLAPAGSWESLQAAIQSGANAIYFGIKTLNMRANAKNFEETELNKVIQECHKNKIKAYLTLNTIIYENELETLIRILEKAKRTSGKPDYSLFEEADMNLIRIIANFPGAVNKAKSQHQHQLLQITVLN